MADGPAVGVGAYVLRWTRGTLRQLLFPVEFRIAQPAMETSLSGEAERLVNDLLSSSVASQPEADDDRPGQEALLVRVATGLWRLKQRMIHPGTDQPKEEMQRAYRHLQSLWDTLVEFGIKIQDHDGEPFDSGRALVVLAYEYDPAVVKETVRETIKPTLYLRGRCIQRGEVIVASPEEA